MTRDVSATLGSTTATDTFRGNEREVEGVQQHGTSSNVGVKGTGTEVELKQEIQGDDEEEEEKEEEEGESKSNDENSFETDFVDEGEGLMLTYSEPPEKHRLDPVALDDEEPQSRDIQKETEEPSLEVLEAPDQTSTAPGSLRSKPSRLVEEGASENIASAKLSALKQELESGEMNTDDATQIKCMSTQMPGNSDIEDPGIEKGQTMEAGMEEGQRTEKEKEEETPGDAGPLTDTFNLDEGRSVEDNTKSTQSQMNAMNSSGRDVSEKLAGKAPVDTFRGNEREVEGVQPHGTSSNVDVRETGTEVELNLKEIQGEEEVEDKEEVGESMPNDENSFETDFEEEGEGLMLTYSEPPEKHRLDPVPLDDEEPQSRDIQKETEEPSLEVLEAPDQTSTAPGSLRSKPSRLVEEGASENIASVKLSALKQESESGEMNAHYATQAKCTSVQTQGDASSDSPSLKSLESKTAVRRDEGNGEEIKQFPTDGKISSPSDATDLKCKKEAMKNDDDKNNDVRAGGGITAPDDNISREAIVVPPPPPSGASRDLGHPPKKSDVEEKEEEAERDADEESGVEKGQMEAGEEEKEKEETPGDAGPHSDVFKMDECRRTEDHTKSTRSQMNAMNSFGRDESEKLAGKAPVDTFRGNEREVEGVQPHGTSRDIDVRETVMEVDLKQEIQGEDEEEGESKSNDENSFEADLGEEGEGLTLTYSEPPRSTG
ncbi:hypothetical protein CRUP_011984 [Coryphaenoides rupestris]|nr:hypothetical protein CRUP_011984 [Coryphaenoides rupestris]